MAVEPGKRWPPDAASWPIGVVLSATAPQPILWMLIASFVLLAGLGVVWARNGGAGVRQGAWRSTFLAALAMAVSTGAGALYGAVA